MIEDAVRTAVEANEWDEASSALVDDLAFGQLLPTYRSESLRKIMQEAGVLGPPDMHFLETPGA